jgi:hypothetical protein
VSPNPSRWGPRSRQRSPRTPRPVHRLVRDAIEAEELGVGWLQSRGFVDVRRIGEDRALGLQGSQIIAGVSFDPLPMKGDVLRSLVAHARPHTFVSFTFAGWTSNAVAWANENHVPLIRFTFAGTLDPSNEAARHLRAK